MQEEGTKKSPTRTTKKDKITIKLVNKEENKKAWENLFIIGTHRRILYILSQKNKVL